jgi:D-threo-aldose 1-dehydrogenase
MTLVPLGRTGLRISRVVLGCAPLGGLFSPVADETARATVDAAWEHGVRAFDTAPHYGAGLSERRLGAALRTHPRADYLLSTKIGRRLVDGAGSDDVGVEIFAEPSGLGRVRDYSRDGVRRSLAESLGRLGLDRADIVHVHDAQAHMDVAIREAVPALCELRDEGVVGAVSAGIDFVEPALRFVRESDVDCILTAGRYTLLDQSAAEELLPLCRERGVAYLAAAPFNSGVLADPRDGATYWYRPAPPDILARARRIADECARHSVGLPAAAAAFPLRHPDVTAVVAGARSPAEVAALTEPVPEELWAAIAPQAATSATPRIRGATG